MSTHLVIDRVVFGFKSDCRISCSFMHILICNSLSIHVIYAYWCLCILGMYVISVVIAQVNFTAIDRVGGQIDNIPHQSLGPYPHRHGQVCPSAVS